jgi:hypothetical protein
VSKDLNPEKAFVFRILHRDNLRWTLSNGLHCAKAQLRDPNFVPIGNADLISRRRVRELPAPHGGTLSDYVPFYFTPHSPMMYNIKTGYNGITRRSNEEILVLVSSFHKLSRIGAKPIFSDRHAYLKTADFFTEAEDLERLSWKNWQNRDFKRDPDDPGKFERYEAECLVPKHLPINGLLGVACYNESARVRAQAVADELGVDVPIKVTPRFYFE